MKLHLMKRSLIALAVAACLTGSTALAAEADSPLLGLPNPIVSYTSYADTAQAAGFTPLYLTKGSGYSAAYHVGHWPYNSRPGLP